MEIEVTGQVGEPNEFHGRMYYRHAGVIELREGFPQYFEFTQGEPIPPGRYKMLTTSFKVDDNERLILKRLQLEPMAGARQQSAAKT